MDTADGIKAAKTKVDLAEEEIDETPAKKKRDDILVKVEENDRQAQSTSDMVDEVHAKNTLQGLPEDLIYLIIPHLGLKDRSSIASTCKRFYELEAKAGMSNDLFNWDDIYIYKNRIELSRGVGKKKHKHLKMECIPFSSMNNVMHRVFRTMKKFNDPLKPKEHRDRPYMQFRGEFDLNEPLDLGDFAFLSDYAVKRVRIIHTAQSAPATVTEEFIEMLPTWTDPDISSDLVLENIRVDSCNMLRLYEKAKSSNFDIIRFKIPINDAETFGKKVLCIKDFSFLKSKKTKMTTSREHEQIYYSTHVRNHHFYMFDGRHYLQIVKRPDKLEIRIHIESPENPVPVIHGGRIPFVSA